jgi:hypothetical protein
LAFPVLSSPLPLLRLESLPEIILDLGQITP